MGKTIILIAALAVAGCATTPAPVEAPRSVWCDHNQPRRHAPEAIAAMTRVELDSINAHNARGELWCGWRP